MIKRFLALMVSGCLLACLLGCADHKEPYQTPTGVTVSQTQSSAEEPTNPSPSFSSAVSMADTQEMDLTVESAPPSSTKKPTDITTLTPQKPNENHPTAPETLHITKGGDYSLTGVKKDVMITVDAGEDSVVLTLAGVQIHNTKGPALYIASGKKVTLVLAEGTQNLLSDGTSYAITQGATTLDAALFSRSDLTLTGTGSLTVQGNYKHGIVSKDDLVISSGNYQVTAKNVALEGKDCVKIAGGSFTLNAGSDGIRATNTQDPNKGFIALSGGNVNITAGNDGLQAQTLLQCQNTRLQLTCGGGAHSAVTSDTASHKGLKAGSDIRLKSGTYTLNTADDAIHSDGTVTIEGGSYTLATGGDALRAATDLGISAGTFTVTTCQDGLQATNIVIAGGNATLTVSQSGIQAKGNYTQTAGEVTLLGTHGSGKSMLNFAGTATLQGGTLLTLGDKSKYQSPTTVTGGCALLLPLAPQGAGTPFTLTYGGKSVVSLTPQKGYSFVLVYSTACQTGKYTLTLGTQTQTFTVTNPVFVLS